MRGDRPEGRIIYLTPSKFTPHARGSTGFLSGSQSALGVYPACAGIDLGALVSVVVWVGLPRMRGDRPDNVNSLYFGFLFTPHARGSTSSNR